MFPFPSNDELKSLILLARQEDLGPRSDDVTSRLLIDENATAVGMLVQKQVGIVCGLPIVEIVCRAYDERLRVEQIPGFHMEIIEGRFNDAQRSPLLRIRGPLRSLLTAERVILNFLQHLSGVATQTNATGAAWKERRRRSTTRAKRCPDFACSTNTPCAAAEGKTIASASTTVYSSRTITSRP